MRIISLAQAPDKIPTQFRGKPIPPAALEAIRNIDDRHHLSYGEVEWIVESLEEDYHFFSAPKPPEWGKIQSQLDMMFTWARNNQKSVLRMTMDAVDKIGYTYSLDTKINQQFESRPWAIAYLLRRQDDFKKNFLTLDAAIPGGITQDELDWLEKTLKLSSRAGGINEQRTTYITKVITWARATKTDLNTMNDFGTAQTLANDWADYQRKVDLSKRLSGTGLRAVALKGKWKAVWINPEAIAKPDPNVADNQRDPRREEQGDYEYKVEKEITGLRGGQTGRIISIRDPSGVSQASIEFGEETTQRIDVLEVVETEEGKQKVKEFVEKMKASGVKLWWAGDPADLESIRDLRDHVVEEHGFVPTVRLPRIGNLDGGRDSYKDALDLAYGEGNAGSEFYPRLAKMTVDYLVSYAEQRNELHVLESARELFGDWAQEQWGEYEMHRGNGVPESPDEDDERFQHPDGTFNEAAYTAAETAYERELTRHQASFDPITIDNYIYQAVEAGMEKPANKSFYDAVKAKAEAESKARHEAWMAEQAEKLRLKEEAERPERERREREEAADKAQRAFDESVKHVEQEDEFPDDFDITLDDL